MAARTPARRRAPPERLPVRATRRGRPAPALLGRAQHARPRVLDRVGQRRRCAAAEASSAATIPSSALSRSSRCDSPRSRASYAASAAASCSPLLRELAPRAASARSLAATRDAGRGLSPAARAC